MKNTTNSLIGCVYAPKKHRHFFIGKSLKILTFIRKVQEGIFVVSHKLGY